MKTLEITDIRIHPFAKPQGKGLAFASFTLNDVFCVTGVRVIKGKEGIFAAMPAKQGTDEEWHDIAFPLTKEFRKQLNDAIVDAYANHKGGAKTASKGKSKGKSKK